MGERRLIDRMRAGDADAGRQLVRDHYAAVYRLLAGLTRDTHCAEDLCQETFAAAWKKLDTFDGRSAFGTWLHRIAYRRFLDWRRSGGNQNPRPMVDQVGPENPSGDAIADEHARLLRDAIDELDEPFREVLVLHYLNGLLHREVAEVTDTPIGTIRWRSREALKRVKQLLPDEMNDEPQRTQKSDAPAARIAADSNPTGT